MLNKAQNIYKELQIIAENLQKREKILKLLEMQPCKEEYNSNEQRRNRQRKEYSVMIFDDILKELLYITKLIK